MSTSLQEITLQLQNRAAIDRIQLLSHSAIIPKSISIEVGDVSVDRENPDVTHASFMPVGEVSFLNGLERNSDGKGRQLQTVEFGGSQNSGGTENMISASFVKLILQQNHPNHDNQYNQVGLLGISIYGIEDVSTSYATNHGKLLQERRSSELEQDAVVARREDLAFIMYTEKDIAEVIMYFSIQLKL